MPTIVNPYRVTVADPYRPVASIGDALASLGDTLFGPKAAQADLMRQKSGQLRREEANLPLLADAIAAGADPGIIAKHGILSGLDPKNAYGYNQGVVVGRSTNPMDPANTRSMMMVPGTSYSSTPQGYERGQQVELQKSENAVRKAAETQIAIADRTQVPVLDANDNPVMITQAELNRSLQDNTVPIGSTAPMRYKPILTDTQQTARLKGMDFENDYAGRSPTQRLAAGVEPAPDKIQNYVEVDPVSKQVTRQGRTVDGVTDLATGSPLSQNAMVVSPLNQGGLKAFESPLDPAAQVARKLQSRIIDTDDAVNLTTKLADMVKANPTIVGPAGNVRRMGQELGDFAGAVSTLFGGPRGYDQGVTAARQTVQQTLGPQAAKLIPELFDSDLNSVSTLHGFLVYKVAKTMGDGDRLSVDDVQRARVVVGDVAAWGMGPTSFIDKMNALSGYLTEQRATDQRRLETHNIQAGQRPVGAVSSPDVESLVKKYAP